MKQKRNKILNLKLSLISFFLLSLSTLVVASEVELSWTMTMDNNGSDIYESSYLDEKIVVIHKHRASDYKIKNLDIDTLTENFISFKEEKLTKMSAGRFEVKPVFKNESDSAIEIVFEGTLSLNDKETRTKDIFDINRNYFNHFYYSNNMSDSVSEQIDNFIKSKIKK